MRDLVTCPSCAGKNRIPAAAVGLKVVKFDVDHVPGVSARFGAKSFPLLLVLSRGKVVDSQVGAPPADALVRWTENAVGRSAA